MGKIFPQSIASFSLLENLWFSEGEEGTWGGVYTEDQRAGRAVDVAMGVVFGIVATVTGGAYVILMLAPSWLLDTSALIFVG